VHNQLLCPQDDAFGGNHSNDGGKQDKQADEHDGHALGGMQACRHRPLLVLLFLWLSFFSLWNDSLV
jgi:hypothetical protein